jgi:hypothetical protein
MNDNLDNTEKSWHRLQIIVRRHTCKKLNNCTANTPNVRSCTNSRHFYNLKNQTKIINVCPWSSPIYLILSSFFNSQYTLLGSKLSARCSAQQLNCFFKTNALQEWDKEHSTSGIIWIFFLKHKLNSEQKLLKTATK